MEKQYTVNYFIEKFAEIPEELFCTVYEDGEQRCYMGHCNDKESQALYKILRKKNESAGSILLSTKAPYIGKSLKERILIALNEHINRFK